MYGATILHNNFFARVMKAPISFFAGVPLGELLNAFSKDQDNVDEALPDTVYTTSVYGVILLTTVCLVSTYFPTFVAIGVAMIIFTVIIVNFYVATASAMKQYVGTTGAYVFGHLSETLVGMSVVRGFGASDRFALINMQRVNDNACAAYHSDMVQLWLSFRLDFIGSLLVFFTAFFCVYERASLEAAASGLAISNSLQLLVFYTWFVAGIAEITTNLNSVGRITSFTKNTPQEQASILEDNRPPASWPAEGRITFNDVVLRYLPHLDPALRGLSVDFRPGEKIGVVGRTGSGKSTMILALFRLIELDSGVIHIDQNDISKCGLDDVRSRLAIIPQDPVMFKGTVRSNLDPFSRCTAEQLWDALKVSCLDETVRAFPLQLEQPIEENGGNFSLGQRQLICLARVFLMKTSILVLDEATASLDLETDAVINRTVNQVFKDRTVVTIAHRLESIITSDRVLVMDAGKAIELGEPLKLLGDSESNFSKLVDQAGPRQRSKLYDLALEHQKSNPASGSLTPVIRQRSLSDAMRPPRTTLVGHDMAVEVIQAKTARQSAAVSQSAAEEIQMIVYG